MLINSRILSNHSKGELKVFFLNCVIKSMTRWKSPHFPPSSKADSMLAFASLPKEKSRLMLVFISEKTEKRKTFLARLEENENFSYLILLLFWVEKGGKRKSHLLYTHSLPPRLSRTQKSQAYFNSFSEKFLIAWAEWMDGGAVAHRYFNGKTKGVKVIFHNFASAFYCSDTMNVNEEESSPISFPFGLLASPSNVNICK